MKSTIVLAALMSTMAVAYKFDPFADSVSDSYEGYGDDDWEAVEPVRARTTRTTTRPVRPAFTTSSRYSCTTTTLYVPAVATTSSKHLEWNAVSPYATTSPSVSIRAITTSPAAQPVAAYTSVSVEAVEAGHWQPWSSTSSYELLTITSSTTVYQVETVTDTLVVETTTSPVYTPVYTSQTTPLYVASTTTLQVVVGQPPINAQITTPIVPSIPAQVAATTTTNAVLAQTSLVATYAGTAAGVHSSLLLVLAAGVWALLC